VGALEHHEDSVGVQPRWSLSIEVGRNRSKEPRRDRHQPLVPALAVGDEHPPFSNPEVFDPQPEDLAATQPAEHHRGHHRPVAVSAQRSGELVDFRRGQDPRQPTRPARQRHPLPGPGPLPRGRQPPRHRVRADVAADLEIAEEPRDERQPPRDRTGRNPGGLILSHLHDGRVAASGALSGDETQHVRWSDLGWRLADHGEEHLQVVGGRQHRVRPAPPFEELQIVIVYWDVRRAFSAADAPKNGC